MPGDRQPAPDGVATAVLATISQEVGADAGPIERGQSLGDDLGLDSLEFVALTQAIEDKLGIRLDEKAVAAVVTVEDVIQLVERTCAAKAGNR